MDEVLVLEVPSPEEYAVFAGRCVGTKFIHLQVGDVWSGQCEVVFHERAARELVEQLTRELNK